MVSLRRWSSLLLLAAGMAGAQTRLDIDASAPAPAPLEGTLKMGTASAPDGRRIGINNQYLTLAGKPWMPVMGEFHYSRTPSHQWEAELRKMKAAGIDIVASYVMWNHHEEQQGRFDWRGQRDLRRFVQLASDAGLYVMVRVGPWVHAEVRYGGIPDWVVNAMPTRRDDPEYLKYVERLYGQIGGQLKGLLWKDGGRVIGVQIENEYNLAGEGEGAGHIATLKRLAVKAGLDVPLYTVTGWDHTLYPSGEVTPVFGGYVDEPWARSAKELPPKETYAFRFGSRVSGDLGAQTRASQQGTAETDMQRTPFIGAEYGAGLPFMYRRRPVVSPADIAAMLPVQLGSGVNLVGYYMFHGGRNPVGATTLEESALLGGYNDTPAINYDFQAPLGPDGQERAVLRHLRPYHLFMRAFGERLAPMAVRAPAVQPRDQNDLGPLRHAVRSRGDAAFLFVNNHVRQYATPEHRGVQFAVKLPGGSVTVPAKPVDVAAGAYFIWPINFDLDGTRLVYATAQPIARLDAGQDGIVYVFGASEQMPVELAFPAAAAGSLGGAAVVQENGLALLRGIQPGTKAALTIAGARKVTVLVLTAEQARSLSVAEFAGRERLVLAGQQAWFDRSGLHLRSIGAPDFRFAVYPALARAPKADVPLRMGREGLFQTFEGAVPARSIAAKVTPLRAARPVPPVAIGGVANAALQPYPESFRNAAAWRIDLARADLKGLDDALIEPDFVGDIGRLFSGTTMVDDWYYSGYPWQVSLRLAGQGPLTLSVLPLRADAPIYIPKEARPDFGGQAQIAMLRGVKVTPVYRLRVTP